MAGPKGAGHFLLTGRNIKDLRWGMVAGDKADVFLAGAVGARQKFTYPLIGHIPLGRLAHSHVILSSTDFCDRFLPRARFYSDSNVHYVTNCFLIIIASDDSCSANSTSSVTDSKSSLLRMHKLDHVTILHNILLTFGAKLALLTRCRLTAHGN